MKHKRQKKENLLISILLYIVAYTNTILRGQNFIYVFINLQRLKMSCHQLIHHLSFYPFFNDVHWLSPSTTSLYLHILKSRLHQKTEHLNNLVSFKSLSCLVFCMFVCKQKIYKNLLIPKKNLFIKRLITQNSYSICMRVHVAQCHPSDFFCCYL